MRDINNISYTAEDIKDAINYLHTNQEIRDDMLNGKEEAKESFIIFVKDFEELYAEAKSIRRFIGDRVYAEDEERDYQWTAWLNLMAVRHSQNGNTFYIKHSKAKEDIFHQVAKMEEKPGDGELLAIVRTWDMWHNS